MGPSVCIVGAGPSGLTTLKTLLGAGVDDVACFDAEDQIGGNWVFKEEPRHASVYDTTHLITSRDLSQFSDFPMPADYPHFPSHRQILAYLQAYADRFDLKRHIGLNSRVVDAQQSGAKWKVTVEGPDGRKSVQYDHLIVCSGHHWNPSTPEIAARFTGESLHSHDYRKAEPFRGKRVLVVGGGNSGCDIAVAVSQVATRTVISMRSGQYIIPKMVFGRPVDRHYLKLKRLPRFLRQALLRLGVRLAIGGYWRYGLAEPDADILEMHPTLNTDVLERIAHGAISPRRAITDIDGQAVRFADGKSETFDTIIWATGFHTAFPFLDGGLPNPVGEKDARLYLRMIPAAIDNLFYIGLVQPTGCIWTLSEMQAQVVAAIISKKASIPADREALIDAELQVTRRNYKPGRRNVLAVDFYDYSRKLQQLLRDSAVRAA